MITYKCKQCGRIHYDCPICSEPHETELDAKYCCKPVKYSRDALVELVGDGAKIKVIEYLLKNLYNDSDIYSISQSTGITQQMVRKYMNEMVEKKMATLSYKPHSSKYYYSLNTKMPIIQSVIKLFEVENGRDNKD